MFREMWTFVGEQLDSSFFPQWRAEITEQQILCYYDGPLTWWFEKDGQRYLAHWIDMDESKDCMRWLVVPISDGDLVQLVDNVLPLRDVLKGDPVYIADEITNGGLAFWKTTLDQVPDDCLPMPGITLHRRLAE